MEFCDDVAQSQSFIYPTGYDGRHLQRSQQATGGWFPEKDLRSICRRRRNPSHKTGVVVHEEYNRSLYFARERQTGLQIGSRWLNGMNLLLRADRLKFPIVFYLYFVMTWDTVVANFLMNNGSSFLLTKKKNSYYL